MAIYTVMRGDTLWSIALKHGVGVNELLKANPEIMNSGLIYPGQTIHIPSTEMTSYKVVPGDTLWSIASKNGIPLSELVKANPQIQNSSFISPGQIINIPTTTSTSAQSELSTLETEVIRLVNVERAKAGKPALTSNNELNRVARIKSNDFINNNYFSHNSPTYGSTFEMLRSFGINYTAAAENIASGQRSAAEVMNTWMASSGHRANILNSTYNQIGVGVARDGKGNLYWTQMFIRS